MPIITHKNACTTSNKSQSNVWFTKKTRSIVFNVGIAAYLQLFNVPKTYQCVHTLNSQIFATKRARAR